MKKQLKRTADQRLIFALVAYKDLTLASLGKRLEPPLTRSTVSRICNPVSPEKPENRIREISDILGVPAEILFPWESEQIRGCSSRG